MARERSGLVGVGLTGHGTAGNIVGKGRPPTVLAHRRRHAVEDLVGREARTARELAWISDVVLPRATGSREVDAAVEGPDGLASAGAPLVAVDCSTFEPASTARRAAELAPRGVTLVDAPLLSGIVAEANGLPPRCRGEASRPPC